MIKLSTEVRTYDLLENFNLILVTGEKGLHRKITTDEISRPGIEILGFFDYYPKEQLQIIGQTEMNYFLNLSESEQKDRAYQLCTSVTPGIIVSNGMEPPHSLIEAANFTGVPILKTLMKTTRTIARITNFLETKFAPTTSVHGVLVEVHGVGILITGTSGVGKSEIALELIKRGHRLVADDRVEIRQEDMDTLVGTSPPLIEHLMEIRGIGIINIMTLFGAESVKNDKKISLIIELELWNDTKSYERLGIEEETMKIIDVDVPKTTIPVRPGRNLAVIIEVAAMNFRLKRMGVNTAEHFSKQLAAMIKRGKEDLD